jgi:hypothetical protein
MSSRNGDKARFGRLRKQKIATRARMKELRESLPKPATTPEPAR